jgi:hypothetical protein
VRQFLTTLALDAFALAFALRYPGPVIGPGVQVHLPDRLTWTFSELGTVQSSIPLTLPESGGLCEVTVS